MNITFALAALDATAGYFSATGHCNICENLMNSVRLFAAVLPLAWSNLFFTLDFGCIMETTERIYNFVVDHLLALEKRAILCSANVCSTLAAPCDEIKREIYQYESFLIAFIHDRIVIGDDDIYTPKALECRAQYLGKLVTLRHELLANM